MIGEHRGMGRPCPTNHQSRRRRDPVRNRFVPHELTSLVAQIDTDLLLQPGRENGVTLRKKFGLTEANSTMTSSRARRPPSRSRPIWRYAAGVLDQQLSTRKFTAP